MSTGGQAWLSNILFSSIHMATIGPTMVGPKETFKIKVFGLLENAILGLVFANTVFYKRATLLIFEAEFTESVL